MIPLEQALEMVLKEIHPLESEGVGLWDAEARVASDSILAPIDLPPFDNSAMDGYAVRAADVRTASRDRPVTLAVLGEIAAGSGFSGRVRSLEAVRVFTGALLPAGADAVVMQEDTGQSADAARIQVFESVKPFENVRFRGGDIKRSSLLVSRGQTIGFAQLAILAAAGVGSIRAFARPKIALLATGTELCEPGQPLGPGQIYESNRIALRALLRHSGAETMVFPVVADSLAATKAALLEAFESCDAVLSTGGVSVGDHDYVKQAFSELDGRIEFWKLALKPGKPFVFGQRKQAPFFGLPGNPVSALVTFQLIVRPAIQKMKGVISWRQSVSIGTLLEPIKNSGDRRQFLRVKMDVDGGVRLAGGQGSHILSSLADSDGLLDMPPGEMRSKGDPVSVINWNGD